MAIYILYDTEALLLVIDERLHGRFQTQDELSAPISFAISTYSCTLSDGASVPAFGYKHRWEFL